MSHPVSPFRRSPPAKPAGPEASDRPPALETTRAPPPPVSFDPRRIKAGGARAGPLLAVPRHPSADPAARGAALQFPDSAPSPTSEPLERPRAELERAIDAGSGLGYHQRAWPQLSSVERMALEQLEQSARSYEQARGGDLVAVPPLWSKPFAALSRSQQLAARTLGLDASTWEQQRAARTALRSDPELGPAVRALFKRPGILSERELALTLLPALGRTSLPLAAQQDAIQLLLSHHGERFSRGARLALRDALFTSQQAHTGAGTVSYNGWEVLPRDGRVVNDAGGRSATPMQGTVAIGSPADARTALSSARLSGTKLSIAGRRHSTGGQTVTPGGLQLDLQGMNRLALQPGDALRAQSGATWAQAQALLSDQGLTLPVTQRSNFFTVGGSLGVNCHGPNAHGLPLSSFVSSLRVLTPAGEVIQCSRRENSELFRHALGGYGLYGLILDATIQAVPEVHCAMEVQLTSMAELGARMSALQKDPSVEVLYAEALPQDTGSALLHIGRIVDLAESAAAGSDAGALRALRNGSSAASGPELLEARRWAAGSDGSGGGFSSRSDLLRPNLDNLRHRWSDPTRTTYLPQAYAVPSGRSAAFFADLSGLLREHRVATSGISVQALAPDRDTALPYARQDSLDFKLHLNPPLVAEDLDAEQRFARDAIDAALDHGGSFYLPFQRHASPQQLRKAYPELDRAFEFKRRIDPRALFSNQFYESYSTDPA